MHTTKKSRLALTVGIALEGPSAGRIMQSPKQRVMLMPHSFSEVHILQMTHFKHCNSIWHIRTDRSSHLQYRHIAALGLVLAGHLRHAYVSALQLQQNRQHSEPVYQQ